MATNQQENVNFVKKDAKKFVLILILLLVAGGMAFYVYRLNNGINMQAPALSQNQPYTRSEPAHSVSSTDTPDIETFYNNVQTGMSPDTVIKLAGRQPDDCARTDREPPSVTCFWYSASKTVTISYGNKDSVQAKSKKGF